MHERVKSRSEAIQQNDVHTFAEYCFFFSATRAGLFFVEHLIGFPSAPLFFSSLVMVMIAFAVAYTGGGRSSGVYKYTQMHLRSVYEVT